MKIKNTIFRIPVINNVLLYEETDSTNLRARQYAGAGCVDGTLIISDMQTSGKGRMGRSFSSPAETGIYMSLVLRPDTDPSRIPGITLIAAMAVSKALSRIENIQPQIKWPNDIVAAGKKIVGILTESGDNGRYVILGIGINVNNESFPEGISDTAGSLYQICGKKLCREDIIFHVWEHFSTYYAQFLDAGDLSFMINDYNSLLASYQKEIYIIPHDKTIHQINPYKIDTADIEPCLCMGIDPHGALICRHHDGRLELVNAGEVSVRGLQGYC